MAGLVTPPDRARRTDQNGTGGPGPARAPWARADTQAHGRRAAVEELACRQCDRELAAGWARAVGFLAGEALDVAEPGEHRWAELQRWVLVPAELEFLDQAASGPAPEPERFVAGVLPALEEERRARRGL